MSFYGAVATLAKFSCMEYSELRTYATQLYRNFSKPSTRFACPFGEPVAAECSRMFWGGWTFGLAEAVVNDDSCLCYYDNQVTINHEE
jgi:hypothetical protein